MFCTAIVKLSKIILRESRQTQTFTHIFVLIQKMLENIPQNVHQREGTGLLNDLKTKIYGFLVFYTDAFALIQFPSTKLLSCASLKSAYRFQLANSVVNKHFFSQYEKHDPVCVFYQNDYETYSLRTYECLHSICSQRKWS